MYGKSEHKAYGKSEQGRLRNTPASPTPFFSIAAYLRLLGAYTPCLLDTPIRERP